MWPLRRPTPAPPHKWEGRSANFPRVRPEIKTPLPGPKAAELIARDAKAMSPSYIPFIGAFHGRTFGALSLTASKASQRRRFAPLLSSVFHAPFPTASRGVTTDQSIERIEELFATVAPPESVAAVFVEPIQGEGGYLVPPDDFLPRLRELTSRHGILLVADEVQSGMGRTGHLLAVEHWGVEPDIVCLAKGIASGLPLGAFIARAEQMSWPPGSHGSTFGGNPIACAAALVTLDLLEDGLMENAARVGEIGRASCRERV